MKRTLILSIIIIPGFLTVYRANISHATPIIFRGDSQEDAEKAKQLSRQMLRDYSEHRFFGNVDEYTIEKVEIDNLNMAHVRFRQTFMEIPVWQGEVIVHLKPDGTLSSVTDSLKESIAVDTTPNVSEQDAVELALQNYSGKARLTGIPDTKLYIYRTQDGDRLTYRVETPRIDGSKETCAPVSFIDAHTGEKEFGYDNLQTGTGVSLYSGLVSIDTSFSNGAYYMEDLARKQGTFNMDNTSGSGEIQLAYQNPNDFWDIPFQQAGVDAHYGAAKTYDYYHNVHGRNGIDGQGGPGTTPASANESIHLLPSRVHYAVNFNQAFWYQDKMSYGDGDGSLFSPLTTIDICGHEMTHGVTERTAGLTYAGESGALNESISDVFGAMIELYADGNVVTADTWKIGEDAYTPGTPGDAPRRMDDPHALGLPDHYSLRVYPEPCTPGESNDNCGVHTNSSIANHAFYLMANGGTNRVTGIFVAGIGTIDAAKIWYRALALYMTESTNFSTARTATTSAAADLFGTASNQYISVVTGWCAIGVGQCPTPTATSTRTPTSTPTPTPTVSQVDLLAITSSNLPPKETWTKQFGTSGDELALSVAVDDGGNSYTVGLSGGALPGQTTSGGAFVRKYDSTGNAIWTKQFGVTAQTYANDIAVDRTGNSYVAGSSAPVGSFANGFIQKYDPNGTLLWSRTVGLTNVDDYGRGIAVDTSGNSFIVGITYGNLGGANIGSADGFIRKYDSGGNVLWTKQLGTSARDWAFSVAVDSLGNSFVTGETDGTFSGQTSSGGTDAFVRKYDIAGNIVWTRQFGTSSTDSGFDIATDLVGSAYVAGETGGSLGGSNLGLLDSFIRKYDGDGNAAWTRQTGSNNDDSASGVAVDKAGNSYSTGYTRSAFPGQTSAGSIDAFAQKYDLLGNVVWTRQFGSSNLEQAYSIAVDAASSTYIAGYTEGSFPGQANFGGDDAFLRKYSGGSNLFCGAWTWRITVVNQGSGTAFFSDSEPILVDDLPDSSVWYGSPTVSNFYGISGVGNIFASITNNTLAVITTGNVSISASGGFTISFPSTPTGSNTFTNPRPAGRASVDPNNVINEFDEINNSFTDTISGTICFTPTASTTPTNTATSTPTQTSTNTPTNTVTGTPTPVGTSTYTSTPTRTPTQTASVTATATPSRRTSFDYDGDHKSDISVFRADNGAWYLQRSTAGFYGSLFGFGTDKIAPADFDGDGKTDIAVYRPSTGIWYVFNSSDGAVSYHIFGLAEDLPTPADYDGDGKADISVFRPSTGTWYRQNSSNGLFYGVQFGASEDKPTIGDFDGDGKSDIAVFRPSTGAWYRINGSDGSIFGETFGFGTDVIVPADYDGDGKTDVAVYRPSNGYWYTHNSSDGGFTYNIFGLAEDIPAPGDFDGDGKADLSVFRPSDGNWYRQNSSDGSFHAFHFGQNGDVPTQAAFRY